MNNRLAVSFFAVVATFCGCVQPRKSGKHIENLTWLQESARFGERESSKDEGASFQEVEDFTLVTLPLERLNNLEGSTVEFLAIIKRDLDFRASAKISFRKLTEQETSNAFKRVLQEQRFLGAKTTEEVSGKKLIVQVIGIQDKQNKGIIFNFVQRDWEYSHRGIYRRPTLRMDTKWPRAFTILVSEGGDVRWL